MNTQRSGTLGADQLQTASQHAIGIAKLDGVWIGWVETRDESTLRIDSRQPASLVTVVRNSPAIIRFL